jgi:hypothetical protein
MITDTEKYMLKEVKQEYDHYSKLHARAYDFHDQRKYREIAEELSNKYLLQCSCIVERLLGEPE